MFAGDILIVSTVNAKRPGSPVNAVCMLPPDAFEFVIPPAESGESAAVDPVVTCRSCRLVLHDQAALDGVCVDCSVKVAAAVETEEFDPLAELSI